MTILDEADLKVGLRKDPMASTMRDKALRLSKEYKTSWVDLGQLLYAVWEDKLFYHWGFEKFEYYLQKELGLNKQLSMKLLKSYIFVEENEPAYLKKEFVESRDPSKVPGYDALNVLRLAKNNKELLFEDYKKIKADIFEKGKDASLVRKDLTVMMRERKELDPDEERDLRNEAALKKLINSLKSFKKDMEALKLVPKDVIEEAIGLMGKLEEQMSK